ncbi:MAG: hypothetical protein IPP99_00345 [Chitinophagaceae bacterium]|nr:hypothetical protein [Chitinophagaceae bacterium]
MAKYLKEEIAFIQLTTAIELFNQKNFISAITLASAAEELFRHSCFILQKVKMLQCSIGAQIDEAMYDLTKDLLGIEDYISYRNKTRNELKHHGEENNKDYVSGDFKSIALMHISGAITNFKLRTNKLPKHKIIVDFCGQQGIS